MTKVVACSFSEHPGTIGSVRDDAPYTIPKIALFNPVRQCPRLAHGGSGHYGLGCMHFWQSEIG